MFVLIEVTCVIMQKNGAGLHTASSCFWDSSTDGTVSIPLVEVCRGHFPDGFAEPLGPC